MLVEVASVSIYELEKAGIGPADVERALTDFAGPSRWDIHKLCAEREIDFNKIGDLMDTYALTERRLGQINDLVSNLFPAGETATAQ